MKTFILSIGVALTILLLTFTGCKGIPPPVCEIPGPQWVVYTHANSPLVSDTINAIVCDGEGFTWICTNEGVSRVRDSSWFNITEELEFAGPFGITSKVYAMTIGKDRSVWFGMAGGGLRRFNRFGQGDLWLSYTTPLITSDMIYSMATDYAGDIWIGTSIGATRFIPNQSDPTSGIWLKYTSANSPIPDEPIRSIGINLNDHTIWFGTYSQGVVSFDGDFDWNISSPSDDPLPIISIAFTPSNNGWFGTYADWVYLYSVHTAEWTKYGDPSSGGGLPNNFVNAVTVGGYVWFGTNNGITKYDGSNWTSWNSENSSLPSDAVKTLALDRHGNLWIGTTHGVAVFNENGTKF